jgi:hypothetical protein
LILIAAGDTNVGITPTKVIADSSPNRTLSCTKEREAPSCRRGRGGPSDSSIHDSRRDRVAPASGHDYGRSVRDRTRHREEFCRARPPRSDLRRRYGGPDRSC